MLLAGCDAWPRTYTCRIDAEVELDGEPAVLTGYVENTWRKNVLLRLPEWGEYDVYTRGMPLTARLKDGQYLVFGFVGDDEGCVPPRSADRSRVSPSQLIGQRVQLPFERMVSGYLVREWPDSYIVDDPVNPKHVEEHINPAPGIGYWAQPNARVRLKSLSFEFVNRAPPDAFEPPLPVLGRRLTIFPFNPQDPVIFHSLSAHVWPAAAWRQDTRFSAILDRLRVNGFRKIDATTLFKAGIRIEDLQRKVMQQMPYPVRLATPGLLEVDLTKPSWTRLISIESSIPATETLAAAHVGTTLVERVNKLRADKPWALVLGYLGQPLDETTGRAPYELRHYCYLAANDDVICMAGVAPSSFIEGDRFANKVKAKYGG